MVHRGGPHGGRLLHRHARATDLLHRQCTRVRRRVIHLANAILYVSTALSLNPYFVGVIGVLGQPHHHKEDSFDDPNKPWDIKAAMRMFSEKTWRRDVRFTKPEFLTVADALGVPEFVEVDGYVRDGQGSPRCTFQLCHTARTSLTPHHILRSHASCRCPRICGKLAFAMMLSRLAQGTPIYGQME
jgi:hypothetical protein